MASFRYQPEIVYDYVHDVDPNLTCAICQSALVDPVTTTSCKHTFCRDCITRALGVNPACPIDRSALTIHSLRDTEQLAKLMLDELKVRCLAEDCGEEMQRGLLLSHLRTCQKSITTCQDSDCGLSMARHRLPHHRAYECFQRQMECRKCGVLLTFRERKSHRPACMESQDRCDLCDEALGPLKHLHQWSCPFVRVTCPHSARGCSAITPRNALSEHLTACPFQALASFFEINDARWRVSEERTDRLEAEVGLLRTELASTRASLSVARQSLGSMWGVAGEWTALPSRNIPRPPTFPLTPTIQTANLPPSSQTPTPTSDILGNTDTLPAYLPNRYSTGERVLEPSRTMFTPSFGSHQSYADYAFSRLAPAGMAGLDEMISGLRGVAVHLAAGLDTLERRSEVRTMTESLRVLEEVGSLRAVVSTMRMQVLMDRPTLATRSVATPSFTSLEPTGPFADHLLATEQGGWGLDSPGSITESIAFSAAEEHAVDLTTTSAGTSTTSLVGVGRPTGLPGEETTRASGIQRTSRNPLNLITRRVTQKSSAPRL